MSHEQVLHSKVGALRTRIRLLLAQQGMCIGLTYAALSGLALVAATRLQWWTDAVDYLWALLLMGAITGLLIGWSRRITSLVAAQIADERAGLKERLSTAVELSAFAERSEVAHAQIADAAQHAETLKASQVIRWSPPPQLKWLALAGIVLAGAVFLPDLPVFQSTQEKLDREAMRAQGEKIQRVAKAIEQQAKKKKGEDENQAIVRRIAHNMKQLGKDQEKNRISKKQAMLKLNELAKQLKESEEKMGPKAQKTLDTVAAELQQAAQSQLDRNNPEAAKALKKMAESLGKRDFDAAKRQLEELARKMQAGQMSREEMENAADMLRQMAEAAQGSNLDQASKEMKEAAKHLSKAAQTAKQLQQAMQGAKSDAERRQVQQQMSQQIAQAMQGAKEQTECAGGT